MKVGPSPKSPLLMLVTCTGPVMLEQELTSGIPDSTWISVPLVDSTWAATPASETATGSKKPWPKMVTFTGWLNCVRVGAAEGTKTFEPYLKAAASMVESPEDTFFTRMLTSWLVLSSPKPRAGGETTMIWLPVTDCTGASRPLKLVALAPAPKKTCTGATKNSPLIVTRVPPSLVPEAGDTEKICGCCTPPPPGT